MRTTTRLDEAGGGRENSTSCRAPDFPRKASGRTSGSRFSPRSCLRRLRLGLQKRQSMLKYSEAAIDVSEVAFASQDEANRTPDIVASPNELVEDTRIPIEDLHESRGCDQLGADFGVQSVSVGGY